MREVQKWIAFRANGKIGTKIALLRATILFFIIRGMKNNTVTLKWVISYIMFPLT
jgi:hypothetical protein